MARQFRVLSGEVFTVVARTEEEALAKFYVATGALDEEEYEGKGFDFTNLDREVEFQEVDTVAEPIDD